MNRFKIFYPDLIFLLLLSALFPVWQHSTARKQIAALYRETFFPPRQEARVEIDPRKLQLLSSEYYDVEALNDRWKGWENSSSVEKAHSGKVAAKLGPSNAFSVAYQIKPDSLTSHIYTSAYIYAEEAAEVIWVVDVLSQEGVSVAYHALSLTPYIQKGKWFLVEFLTPLGVATGPKNNIAVYFWYPEAGEAEVFIDDITISAYGPFPDEKGAVGSK